ncbi:hypothetical protein LTR78_010641 [Recurvomyces mirabilis]|uniref:Vitamin H transporter n=1 Tax=Recurvomyces mirabilis TaxID=574656 RepID=A0AAE0TM48_9PEZI|nr:hypothetical protein LTR78_010641 [Recurvomyces mirabilis]KAK5149565.1 hypothetical protein LTS14_010823 [Recurvomyces mirabilis]
MASQTTPINAAAVYSEKTYNTHLKDGSDSSLSSRHKHDNLAEAQTIFDDATARRITRRVDRRLIPALGLMYGVSLMDRKNVSNAYIAGMRQDLNLISYRYSLITLTFFITYVIFQPPLTYLCRKIGPPIFLPASDLGWRDHRLWIHLKLEYACWAEAAVVSFGSWRLPWYEVAKRYGAFYPIGSLASALSGILAYGLMQMGGVAGIRGWRWIFIMEGVITCSLGLLG